MQCGVMPQWPLRPGLLEAVPGQYGRQRVQRAREVRQRTQRQWGMRVQHRIHWHCVRTNVSSLRQREVHVQRERSTMHLRTWLRWPYVQHSVPQWPHISLHDGRRLQHDV